MSVSVGSLGVTLGGVPVGVGARRSDRDLAIAVYRGVNIRPVSNGSSGRDLSSGCSSTKRSATVLLGPGPDAAGVVLPISFGICGAFRKAPCSHTYKLSMRARYWC